MPQETMPRMRDRRRDEHTTFALSVGNSVSDTSYLTSRDEYLAAVAHNEALGAEKEMRLAAYEEKVRAAGEQGNSGALVQGVRLRYGEEDMIRKLVAEGVSVLNIASAMHRGKWWVRAATAALGLRKRVAGQRKRMAGTKKIREW